MSMQALTAPGRTHTARFRWISLIAIVVSFAHMAATMLLFEEATWWAKLVGAGNTLLVDLTIWGLVEYRHWAREQHLRHARAIDGLLGLALLLAVGLNAGSLWANRPHEAIMSPWLALPLVAGFSVLVPGIIAVAALIRGEIASHNQQQETERQTSSDLRQQLAHLTQQLKAALAERDTLRQMSAQLQADLTSRATSLAQLAQSQQEHGAARQQLTTELHSLRQQLTQAQQETTQVRQVVVLMRQEHDEQMHLLQCDLAQAQQKLLTDDAPVVDIGGRRYTTRQLAQAFETSETSVRRKLAQIGKDTLR